MNANEMPTNVNPLDMDFSDVEIKRSVLAGGMPYELLIRKCELQDSKSHVGDKMIYIELSNVGPASSPTGESINPNQVVIRDRINLKPYGKATQQMVNETIARFQQATGVKGPLQQVVAQANGKVVRAKVKVVPAGVNAATQKSYPEKNEVDYYYKFGQQ